MKQKILFFFAYLFFAVSLTNAQEQNPPSRIKTNKVVKPVTKLPADALA